MALTEGIGDFMSVAAAAPATYDATGFTALSWSDMDQAESIPNYGANHATVEFTPIKTGIVNKGHGALNYGTVDIPFAVDSTDPAQAILKAARISKNEISFKETFSDGSERYFAGKVMSFMDGGAQVNSVKTGTCRVEITNEVIEGP